MPNGSHDTICNRSGNPTFQEIVEVRLSRRRFIGGGLATAATLSLGSVGTLLDVVPVSAKSRLTTDPLLGFLPIAVSSADEVVVAPGYTAKVLVAWGDPVSDGPEFQPDASNTAAEQAQQWGMHNDGLVYFPLDRGRGVGNNASDHGLLVQNHEYTDDGLLFPDGNANWTAEKTLKSQNAHGVGVIEIKRERRRGRGGSVELGEWQVVRPSAYARRLTGRTPMAMAGPVARLDQETGDPRLITSADPTGRRVLGTINNCAMGFTPWGTYLACEENFNGYFRKAGTQTPLEQRYGINSGGAGYLWHTTDQRAPPPQPRHACTVDAEGVRYAGAAHREPRPRRHQRRTAPIDLARHRG